MTNNKEHIQTILKFPVPISYLIKNNLICAVCLQRPGTYEDAQELLDIGVCRKCIAEDHVQANVNEIMRDEYERN